MENNPNTHPHHLIKFGTSETRVLKNFIEEIELTSSEIEQLTELVNQFPAVFPIEKSWVRENHGAPSLLVRVDYTRLADGRLGIYEIEDRPAGLSINQTISQTFADNWNQFYGKNWPEFVSVESNAIRKQPTDDAQAIPSYQLENLPEDRLVIVRASPSETQYHDLVPQSISSVIYEGHKSYLTKLNIDGNPLATTISSVAEIPRGEAKVIKSTGARCYSVLRISPNEKLQKLKQKFSELQAKSESGEVVMQDFFEPMIAPFDSQYHYINRLYFFFNTKTCKYEPAGGLANAVPSKADKSWQVHGRPDALVFPIELTKKVVSIASGIVLDTSANYKI